VTSAIGDAVLSVIAAFLRERMGRVLFSEEVTGSLTLL